MSGLNPIWGLDRPDRYTMGRLLGRLPEVQREDWLRWCCQHARGVGKPTDCLGPYAPDDVYLCWCHLCSQCGLDLEASRIELERRVRRHGLPVAHARGAQLLA